MSAAWPAIVTRLVSLLPTLPGWSQVAVYDGPPVTQAAPQDFVTVGFVVGEDFGGTLEPVPVLGDIEQETGSVRSEIVCTSGETDIAIVRQRAFGLYNSWLAAVRADPTLGVLPSGSTTSLAVDVQPVNTGGAVQRLAVTLSYTARV